MFLKRLNQIEKEAFVSLAVKAAEANGQVADEEHQMIEEYCNEMSIAFFDAENVKPIEEVIKVFADSEIQHKRIAVLETIGLMYADGTYDAEERAFVEEFADGIGVSRDDVKKSEETLVRYIDITRDLVECIDVGEGEEKKKGTLGTAFSKAAKAAAAGVAKGAKFAANGVATGALKAADSIRTSAEENAKKKAEKQELRKEIRAEIEAEKQRCKEDKSDESNHTVVEMKKSGMKLLIPDGYEKMKVGKTGDPRVDKANERLIYGKDVRNSKECIILFDVSADDAMDFKDKQGIIDGIHQCLADNQGIICVESGKTVRGYDYIYSIVKTLGEEPVAGVMYCLVMNIGYNGKVIEVQGSFAEVGDTGFREAVSLELTHRAGMTNCDNLEGWSEDPYNPEYTQGITMNLAERSGLDGMFPYSPLSQTRELVRALLFDELMEEVETEETEAEETETDGNDSGVSEKEKMLLLFDKGEECRRNRYTVKVKQ